MNPPRRYAQPGVPEHDQPGMPEHESAKRIRGRRAHTGGRQAEDRAALALEADGWGILHRRLRTPLGEIDLVARQEDLVAVVEVKARRTAATAAGSVSRRQRLRLIAAAEWLWATQTDWAACSIRFDVIVVGADGTMRRIADAFRADD